MEVNKIKELFNQYITDGFNPEFELKGNGYYHDYERAMKFNPKTSEIEWQDDGLVIREHGNLLQVFVAYEIILNVVI